VPLARICRRTIPVGCLLLVSWGCDLPNDPVGLPGASLSTPSPAAAPSGVPVYTVTPITAPTAGGGAATGVRVNQSGDVAGWTIANFPAEPILITPENGVIVLPTATAQHYGIAHDLSDRQAGVITVVGEARLNSSGGAIHAVRWRVAVPQGTVLGVTDLGVLPGQAVSLAYGVNGAGQIAGTSDPNSSLSIRSFLYSPTGGMKDLGLGSVGTNAVARDLNDAGVVAGYLGLRAFRWSTAGGLQSLGTPAGWANSFATAINASGQVTGSASSASGNAEVVARYTNGSGWQILGGTGQHNTGRGINQWGDVVGTGVPYGSLRQGVIYTDNLGFLALVDDLLLMPGSWKVQEAYDINDAQQITGWAINSQTGLSSAVLLTPVNPPPPNQPPVAGFSASCNALFYCSFDGSSSTDDRAVLRWVWSANGQTIGTGKFTGVQFGGPQTVNLTLTVTDARGATGSVTKPVVIGGSNQPPVADFTYSCTAALLCTFDGTPSSDDRGIVAWSWVRSNGVVLGSTPTFTRQFLRAQTFAMTLTVTDAGGLASSITKTVVVGNQPPVARFTNSCNASHFCSFDGTGSTDDVGVVSWVWKRANGTVVATTPTFTRQFQQALSFGLTLTVTDGGGLNNSITRTIVVP